MQKLDFQKKDTNFWFCRTFAEKEKYPDSSLLSQAYEQKVLKDDNEDLLIKFINFLEKNQNNQITSQLYQDMFAEFINKNNAKKTFLEFGATDGLKLSNSFTLESFYGWNGVLAEPDPQWHSKLQYNRPKSKIIFDCIWKKSNEELDFISSSVGEYSTIENFKFSDKDSMPSNAETRNQNIKKIKVKTISINDVINQEFNNIPPTYISIDTEGSEFEILNSFNFKLYRPNVFTIEHNYSKIEKEIDELLKSNGYLRIFRKLSAFDAWYVCEETLKNI